MKINGSASVGSNVTTYTITNLPACTFVTVSVTPATACCNGPTHSANNYTFVNCMAVISINLPIKSNKNIIDLIQIFKSKRLLCTSVLFVAHAIVPVWILSTILLVEWSIFSTCSAT